MDTDSGRRLGHGGEGAPVPVRAPWLPALLSFLVGLVLVAGAVLPALQRPEESHGATRSVHLERQKRQQQAREAAARAAAGQEDPDDAARPEPGD